MPGCIYLDNMATTPLDPAVAEAMRPYLLERFGNPHSQHPYGWEAAAGVDWASERLAALIGARPEEIVFTSGATEANNQALRGVALAGARRGGRVLISAIEHKCVWNAAVWLREQGLALEVVPVDAEGRLDPAALIERLGPDVVLVSVMLANNEIGSLQPLEAIGAACRRAGIPLHCDAAQAVGKIPLDVEALGVDLLGLSAHKFYGPKGIGALYLSRNCPVQPEPLILGGGQQGGRRSGTVPPFLCVGLGAAAAVAAERFEQDHRHILALESLFLERLGAGGVAWRLNGPREGRIPGCLNLRFPGRRARELLATLGGRLAVSTGATCDAAGVDSPSPVLTALGLSPDEAACSIRFGFGRFSTAEEVGRAADLLAQAITQGAQGPGGDPEHCINVRITGLFSL